MFLGESINQISGFYLKRKSQLLTLRCWTKPKWQPPWQFHVTYRATTRTSYFITIIDQCFSWFFFYFFFNLNFYLFHTLHSQLCFLCFKINFALNAFSLMLNLRQRKKGSNILTRNCLFGSQSLCSHCTVFCLSASGKGWSKMWF